MKFKQIGVIKILDNKKEFVDKANTSKISSFISPSNEYIVNDNVNLILSELEQTQSILCFGEVQSGKTENILQLIDTSLEKGYDLIILFGGTTNLLFSQTKARSKKIIKNFHDRIYVDKTNKNFNLDLAIEQNKKIFINTLKESSNLTFLENQLKKSSLSNKKILIIDDESDYASINTGIPESKIFELIKSMLNQSLLAKLCMFTATPYANLINNRSKNLKPERVVILKHHSDYIGLEFFNKNQHIYKVIDSKNNIDLEKIFFNVIKNHLFFSALHLFNTKEEQNFELVINISQKDEDHDEQRKIFKNALYNFETQIVNSRFFDNFKDQLNEAKKRKLISEDINLTKEIWEIYLLLRKDKNLICLNFNQKEYFSGHSLKVIVGGYLISRGFTFKKLLTEVMLNVPTTKINADTLAQRARWFGYRSNYFQYMNIYLDQRTLSAFQEIEDLNNIILSHSQNNVIKNINLLISNIKNKEYKYINLTGDNKYGN